MNQWIIRTTVFILTLCCVSAHAEIIPLDLHCWRDLGGYSNRAPDHTVGDSIYVTPELDPEIPEGTPDGDYTVSCGMTDQAYFDPFYVHGWYAGLSWTLSFKIREGRIFEAPIANSTYGIPALADQFYGYPSPTLPHVATHWQWVDPVITTYGQDIQVEAEPAIGVFNKIYKQTPVKGTPLPYGPPEAGVTKQLIQRVKIKSRCQACTTCDLKPKVTLGSAHLRVPMGRTLDLQSSMSLKLDIFSVFNYSLGDATPPLTVAAYVNGGRQDVSTATLMLRTDPPLQQVIEVGLGSRQFVGADMIANVIAPTGIPTGSTTPQMKFGGYTIKLYERSSASRTGSAPYTFTGNPIRTILVGEPNGAGPDPYTPGPFTGLKINDGDQILVAFYDREKRIWTLSKDSKTDPLLGKSYETRNADGTLTATFENFEGGVLSNVSTKTISSTGAVVGTSQSGSTETITRSTVVENGVTLNIEQRLAVGEAWEKRYTSIAGLVRVVRQLNNNSILTTSDGANICTDYTVTNGIECAVTTTNGLETSRIYQKSSRSGGVKNQFTQKATVAAAGWDAPTNIKTGMRQTTWSAGSGADLSAASSTTSAASYPPASGSWRRDLTVYIQPDGTVSKTEKITPIDRYSFASNRGFTKKWTGSPASPAFVFDPLKTLPEILVNGGRFEEVQPDEFDRWITEKITDVASAKIIQNRKATTWDNLRRPTTILYDDDLNGTFGSESQETVNYGCCGAEGMTDRTGAVSNTTYDLFGHVATETHAGVRMRYVNDQSGRRLQTFRAQWSGSTATNEQLIQRTIYNTAGRVITEKNLVTWGGAESNSTYRVTNFVEAFDANDGNRLTRTTTYPDGGTRIEKHYLDGRLWRVTGTAVAPLEYAYGVTTGSSVTPALPTASNYTFVEECKLDASGARTNETVTTYSDMAGRNVRRHKSGLNPEEAFYNNKNQLVKSVDGDGVTMLYEYNDLGERIREAVDINRNGSIEKAGTDRVTETTTLVATSTAPNSNATTVIRKLVKQWLAPNVDTETEVSYSETTPDGRSSWQRRNGQWSSKITNWLGSGSIKTTTILPDNSSTVEQSVDGRLATATRLDNTNTQIAQQTFAYNDPYKRLTGVTDAANGLTSYTYYDDDQIQTVTTPDPDGPSLPDLAQVTRYYYDGAGRKNRETEPDNQDLYSSYTLKGQLEQTWGARAYPTKYTYDAQGRIRTLTTRQGGTDWVNATGIALTTWNYYATSGLLENKRYSDNIGPDYTYTPGGRLQTKKWARDKIGGGRITATYGYTNAGELEATIYNDSLTPPVTLAYNRRGQLKSRDDASGHWEYGYQPDGQLDTETASAGVFNGMVVDRGFDSFNRLNALDVTSLGYTVGYGYDSANRLNVVTSGVYSTEYARRANSELIRTITHKQQGVPGLTATNTHDNLNRLKNRSTVSQNTTAFDYTYNSANQRTKVDRGTNFTSYGYDDLGQVTSASKFWSDNSAVGGQQFEYTFDQIGNRTGTKTNGRVASYTPNLLNEYSDRVVPGAFDVVGTAAPDTTVTVNNQGTTRKGDYFSKAVPVENRGSAAYRVVKTVGVKSNGGPNGADAVSEDLGFMFVPKSPEVFEHDLDGNQTKDGRWTYTWDAENRLVNVETIPAAASIGTPKQKLTFGYDGFSRRISKKVENWSGTAWTTATERRFVYDGWNLLVEINVATALPVAKYVWGLDLSGSMQGAGGVGGLLLSSWDVAVNAWQTAAPVYDGNGNIASLADLSNGAVVGDYEYGPFGEPLRATGALAKVNPFRFSTKYEDNETGLLYYGYRYYTASTGRWLNRDPIEEDGGENIYGFVYNQPIRFIDLLGLDWIEYTGQGMTLYDGGLGDKSSPKMKCIASSGLPGSQDKSKVGEPDKGPVPPGDYSVNLVPNPARVAPASPVTGELTPGNGMEQIPPSYTTRSGKTYTYPGWGSWRARLNPKKGTKTYGRSSFYLHDSNKSYTHGCIETCKDLLDELKKLRAAGDKNIDVRVDYTDPTTVGGIRPTP